MEFLKILLSRSKLFYFFLSALSIANGLLNMGLLIFINKSITHSPLPFFPRYGWLVFLLLIVASLTVSKVFHTYMVKLTTNVRSDLQISILRKLKLANYQEFEKLGNEKVFTAMGDINTLSNIPEVFVNMVNALIMIICSFTYLFYISAIGGAFILFIMAALLLFYLVRNRSVEKKLNIIRNLQNDFWRYLNDLIWGFKETKMRTVRNENIHSEYLERNVKESRQLSIDASIKYLNNELTGNYSWYITFWIIMFLLPGLVNLREEDVVAFLITILYLMGPVAILITLIPIYTNVKIALQRLNDFDNKLRSHITYEEFQQQKDDFGSFESIRFENVKFEYFDYAREKTFSVGPVNMEIKKNETVFIVGDNGSGKTTIAYLLTGLYRPSEGRIYLNGIQVADENAAMYRNRISAIYTNNYLFAENYDGFDLSIQNPKLSYLIDLLKLNAVAKSAGDGYMLDKNLSKGQQKRLAMIYSLLENNQVIVLDEWAAEQDPAFRHYFYEVLLPVLKGEGKTIIAITHDNDFYHCCDRIIRFAYGSIATDQKAKSFSMH